MGASFIVSVDITVYANWINRPEGELVTVSFDENGGTSKASPRELTIKKGATILGGHFVSGWNFAAGGSRAEFSGSYMVDSDITVYA